MRRKVIRESAFYLAFEVAVPLLLLVVFVVARGPLSTRGYGIALGATGVFLAFAWMNYKCLYLELTDVGVTVHEWLLRRAYCWADIAEIDWGPYSVYCTLNRPRAESKKVTVLGVEFRSTVVLAGRRHGSPSQLAEELRTWKSSLEDA